MLRCEVCKKKCIIHFNNILPLPKTGNCGIAQLIFPFIPFNIAYVSLLFLDN